MKKVSAVLAVGLFFACGGTSNNPAPDAGNPDAGNPDAGSPDAGPTATAVTIPGGASLKPYNTGQPGLARPQGMALADGNVYIALGNYDENFNVRGPSFLGNFVPSTGNTTLIDLGGADGQRCKSSGIVRESGGLLYAVCAGDFNDSSGTALVEVDPASQSVTRSVSIPTSPAGVAAASTRLWVGDGFGGNLYAVDKASFTVVAGPISFPCPATGTFTTTSDVLVSGGDLYALCSNNTGGILSRLDAITGALKMQADVGPTSVEIADIGDGRLAIVSGADNSIHIVTISATALNVQAFSKVFASGTSTLQDIRTLGHFLYTAASGSNTVQKIDLNAAGGPAVVKEVNTGTGASPWNVLPLDDDNAVVSNQSSNNLSRVTW